MSGIMLAMNLSGCSFFVKKDSGNTDIQSVRQESENADKTVMKRSKSEEKEAEEILEICSKTYAKAEKEGKLDDLEMIRDLIKELGEKGFTAVDSENQVNMTEYEKLIQFSEKAEAKKNGRMTVVEVAKGGSCIIRNMETHDGIVNMIRSYCIYENGKLKQSSEDIYRTESWEYTEDGHLMFSGRLAFEGSYEVTRNEIMKYINGVHGAEIRKILHEHGGFYHVCHACAGSLEHGFKVLERLFRLRGNAFCKLAGGGIDAELAGGKHNALHCNRMAVRAECGGCVCCDDDFFHFKQNPFPEIGF